MPADFQVAPITSADEKHYKADRLPKASLAKYGFEFEIQVPNAKVAEVGIIVNSYHSENYGGTADPLPDFFNKYLCPVTGDVIPWKAERDGSLWRKDGYTQMEFISPPMIGEGAFLTTWKMLQKLQELGCKVDFSCGLHIHVGLESITGDAKADEVVAFLVELNKFVISFQDGLYAQTGTRRDIWLNKGTKYCRPFTKVSDVIQVSEQIRSKRKGTKTSEDMKLIKRMANKYSPLNCTKIEDGGAATLEFRFMASTLNFEKVALHLVSIMTLIRLAWKNRHVQRDAASYDLNKGYHKGSKKTKGVRTLKALLTKINRSKAGRLIRVDSPTLACYWDKMQTKGVEMAKQFDAKVNRTGPRG